MSGDGSSVFAAEPESKLSAGTEQLLGTIEKKRGHPDGSAGEKIKAGVVGMIVFEAKTANLDPMSYGEHAAGFREKDGLFYVRFKQGCVDMRAKKANWDGGEAGARTNIEKVTGFDVRNFDAEERFPEMAGENLFGIGNRGEIDTAIPAKKERDIVGNLPGMGIGNGEAEG